jgi:hypothetical protein
MKLGVTVRVIVGISIATLVIFDILIYKKIDALQPTTNTVVERIIEPGVATTVVEKRVEPECNSCKVALEKLTEIMTILDKHSPCDLKGDLDEIKMEIKACAYKPAIIVDVDGNIYRRPPQK